MKTKNGLSGGNLRTYSKIFQHPLAHNLQWQDVYSLFRHLGTVEEQPNGNFKVDLEGRVLILRPSIKKDVSEAEELMALRHFLKLSKLTTGVNPKSDNAWLLVIDHQEARIFRSGKPGTDPEKILPPDPDEFFRHRHNSLEFKRGKEIPDPNVFFQPVAEALAEGESILIFGNGKGSSNEMDQFVAWVEIHHPELARRIVGSLVIDESHMTENQLLAKAREYFETLAEK